MDPYAQLYEHYEQGTLDDPILIRAFDEARPNRELAQALEETHARLNAAEAELAAAEVRRQRLDQNHEDALQRAREASKRALKAMDAQVRELRARKDTPAPVMVTFEPGEADTLRGLGWSKNAAN